MRVVAILFCVVAVVFVSLALASLPKVSEEFSAIINVTISEKNGTASQHQNPHGNWYATIPPFSCKRGNHPNTPLSSLRRPP
jgi:hypothetical protein